jgi:Electron transfer DM13
MASVLRLDDDFRVTNGPDLYVYLSGHASPRSSAELHAAGDFEVAVLNGNIGGQTEPPVDLDIEGIRSVVIYCRRFTTVFSTAELVS